LSGGSLKSFWQKRRLTALAIIVVVSLVVGLLITQVILPQLNVRNRRVNEVWPNQRAQVAAFDAVFDRSFTLL
jgi:hypothetical protein